MDAVRGKMPGGEQYESQTSRQDAAESETLGDVNAAPKTFVELIPATLYDRNLLASSPVTTTFLCGFSLVLLTSTVVTKNVEWWAYFSRLKMDDEELADDSEAS